MGCSQSSDDVRVSPETSESPENGKADKESEDNDFSPTKERSCTDVFFLILIAAFVIVLIALLIYCMIYGNIYRLVNGYDDCGNVCGRMNSRQGSLGCSGADRTNEEYLLVDPGPNYENPSFVHRMCVNSCERRAGYKSFLKRCLPIRSGNSDPLKSLFSKTGLKNFFQEVSEDLQSCWKQVLLLCVLSFVLSVVIIFSLRYIVRFVVWLVLIGVIVALIAGTIFLWIEYKYITDDKENTSLMQERKNTFLGFAIIATIATICITLVIIALRNRIALVVQLFKEAGKAISSMPLILLEPMLTFVALTFLLSMWLYFALNIESAGYPEVENNQSVQYVKDGVMKFSRWYNLFALFWFVNFIIGCQHMVIAGAVSTWFFTRNKSQISSPIKTSLYNLVRYHIGTVALGSLCLSLVNMLRVMLKFLKYILETPTNPVSRCCQWSSQCCLFVFERFLQYLTTNAYIETALSAHSFCKAGSRAFSILSSNALRVVAINSVGDFVLILSKAFVVLCTVLVGVEIIEKKEGLHHAWVPLAIAGLFAYTISHCFISVYEMTIDTIFLCFCEDCENNDGISKPYYMSRSLMAFVEESKKVLLVTDQKSAKAWTNETIS